MIIFEKEKLSYKFKDEIINAKKEMHYVKMWLGILKRYHQTKEYHWPRCLPDNSIG